MIAFADTTDTRTEARGDAIVKVETFIVSIPRDVPYLGPLKDGESINSRGYLIRKGNRSIYPSTDQSLLVKITSESGHVGWGESYAMVAPTAVKAIVDDLLGPVLVGRSVDRPVVLHEDLYDLMRVRGFFGGYYLDALAGVDIACWDLFARCVGRPLVDVLGGRRHDRLAAYVSGLPKATLPEKCDLARSFVARGFKGIKFAASVAEEDIVDEMAALREAVGPDIDLMVDLHWKFTAAEAIRLIRKLEPFDLFFAEAPVEPEDLEGQVEVGRAIGTRHALGEEWHTAYEYRPRFVQRAMSVIQPEIAHTGITQFMTIGRMANVFHVDTIPHASVGIGIFQAASLHATSALKKVSYHEYQHSIFDKNLKFVTGDMACEAGFYRLPSGNGLGVVPDQSVFDHVIG